MQSTLLLCVLGRSTVGRPPRALEGACIPLTRWTRADLIGCTGLLTLLHPPAALVLKACRRGVNLSSSQSGTRPCAVKGDSLLSQPTSALDTLSDPCPEELQPADRDEGATVGRLLEAPSQARPPSNDSAVLQARMQAAGRLVAAHKTTDIPKREEEAQALSLSLSHIRAHRCKSPRNQKRQKDQVVCFFFYFRPPPVLNVLSADFQRISLSLSMSVWSVCLSIYLSV